MTFWSILFIIVGILIIAFMIFTSSETDNEFTGCGCGCGCWFILVGIIMLFSFVIGAGIIIFSL